MLRMWIVGLAKSSNVFVLQVSVSTWRARGEHVEGTSENLLMFPLVTKNICEPLDGFG